MVALARNAVMTAFDHARPLWEFTLVEGLAGGRAAMVMKMHHALTDGIGGMQLALRFFDAEPIPGPSLRPVDGAGSDGDGHDRRLTLGTLGHGAVAAVPAALHAGRHPVAVFVEGLETVRSIGRTVAPVKDTLSPIMQERSCQRQLGLLEVQLDDLKRAASDAGGSINDGFMAAVTGGLRRYHERHGVSVEELRVTFPISIRKPDDLPGGNRITLIRFAVPVADADPASRIRAMGRLCHTARDERSLRYVNGIAATLNVLPRAAIAGMLKHVDFVASDVPGFAFPIYLAGARVERFFAFAPDRRHGREPRTALVRRDVLRRHLDGHRCRPRSRRTRRVHPRGLRGGSRPRRRPCRRAAPTAGRSGRPRVTEPATKGEIMTSDQLREHAAHPIAHPLVVCPACGSDRLDPVVEDVVQDVHFLCRDCDRCWNVSLGYVRRVAPATCLGCPERSRCEHVYAAEHESAAS